MACNYCSPLRVREGICINDFNLDRFPDISIAEKCRNLLYGESWILAELCLAQNNNYIILQQQCEGFEVYFKEQSLNTPLSEVIHDYCNVCFISPNGTIDDCIKKVTNFYTDFCPSFAGNVSETKDCKDWMKECYLAHLEGSEKDFIVPKVPFPYYCLECQ